MQRSQKDIIMLGYLIFDSGVMEKEIAETTISELLTFKLLKNFSMNNTEIFIFKNRYNNNYIMESKNFLLFVVGTLLYNSFKGNDALKMIIEKLNNGKKISEIYSSFLGPYNLICVNKRNNKIQIITCKEGLQNGYFFMNDHKQAFSSNLLLLASLVGTSLDKNAICQFVHFGICMEGKTIFNSINKMKAGTIFNKINRKWYQKKIWQIEVKSQYLSDSSAEIVRRTSCMIIDSLKVISNIDEKNFALDLTGGTDTRAVLSFLLEHRKNLVVSTGGPTEHIDVKIAERISKKLGLNHFRYHDIDMQKITYEKIDLSTEIADGNINQFFLLKSLSQLEEKANRFEIILGGNGGAFYKDHYWLFEFNKINRMSEPNWKRLARLSIINYPIQEKIFIEQPSDIFSDLAKKFLDCSKAINGKNNQKLDYIYFTMKCPDSHSAAFTTTNQYLDVYHPLMNGEIVEYMININPNIRKRNVLLFSMIYNNNKELAWIKTENGYPAVPPKGKFLFLRIFVLMRYLRALLRRLDTFLLKRTFGRPDSYIKELAEQLKELNYFDMLKYDRMKTASIFSEKEIKRIVSNRNSISNLMYTLNILSVELTINRVEKMGKKTLSF
jgi:hypothetical protein